MELFRKAPGGRFALPLAMAGVKTGERVLIAGAGHPRMSLAIAVKAGLSGRAAGVAASERDIVALRRAAAAAGVLLDTAQVSWTRVPHDAASFDVAVVDATRGMLAALAPPDRAACLGELHRVLRPGGRVLVVERTGGGLAALWRGRPASSPEYHSQSGAVGALRAAGFRPVRLLAERAGWRFTEGIRQAQP